MTTPFQFAQYKLNTWPILFSKFTNPKALHSIDTLFALYCPLLSHPNHALQTVVLSCVFTYKLPSLVWHEEMLQHFLDDTLWWNTLVHLNMFSLDPTD